MTAEAAKLSREDVVCGRLLERYPRFQRLHFVLTDSGVDPEEVRREVIREIIHPLPEPDKTVCALRWGAEGPIQKNSAIGKRVGYSLSSVSRVVKRALRKLDELYPQP